MFLAPNYTQSQTSVVAGSVPTANTQDAPPAISADLMKEMAPICHRLLIKSSDLILVEFFSSDMHPWCDELEWATYSDIVEEVVHEVVHEHETHQDFFPEEEQLTMEEGQFYFSARLELLILKTPFQTSALRTLVAW
jgi:hypothetical protein